MATSLRVPLAWARLAGASRSSRRGRDMRASTGEPPESKAGDSGSRTYSESNDGGQPSSEIRIRNNCWKLIKKRSNLELRRILLTVRTINQWNSLSSEAVDASSLDAFKRRLDSHLSETVYGLLLEQGAGLGKKFVYVEPPRRVREVLEEELYFQRDECRIRHPSEVALERIWSLKRNFPVGGFNPASQNQNCFLSQPYYSRHAVIRR